MTTAAHGLGHRSETFREDWLDGMANAYARTVRRVPGASGLLGRHAPRPGKVSVVIGGGSGHYPAFAGLVGTGLADAAAIGDVFASPSAEQVYRTARAADAGAGVLLTYGNYAGDVMHFGLAARRLAADGTETRTVLVTDDVASGPPPVEGAPVDPSRDRRGVAGDFFVFKVAGASAERGDDLATVARLAAHANAHTRTFGVAFAGCTLPGAEEPLFTVAPGTCELGMGIHGEPGLRTGGTLDPEGLAEALVEQLLPDLPQRGDGRVAVLLNGLGATKGEELFAVYRFVCRRLTAAGLRPFLPEVGEFVTSFDMAGVSLSLMVLDDELAELYAAPCDTPAFRRLPGAGEERYALAEAEQGTAPVPAPTTAPGPDDGVVTTALQASLDLVAEREAELGRLDAVAGDGDHGRGIVRGLRAAVARAREVESDADASAGSTLMAAGLALADASGGASGALYGALLTETGACLTGLETVRPADLARAARSAQETISALGGAQVGDKTMLDALAPFAEELAAADARGEDLAAAWDAAAAAATEAAARTADLVPVRGRAARMGSLSQGHPDAGATSLALILSAAATTLNREPATP
ncbi:dihydroxyacetone kinase family protein [Streptomyces sp. NPDC059740]|uniref:dihydroxyacetone kinase family protein n=1 Tax=Streptomyces sp. NPDC059740 TaxID=3346926 RepID=UPI0036483146